MIAVSTDFMIEYPVAVKGGLTLFAAVTGGGVLGLVADAITESTTVSLPIAWVVGGAACFGCFWLATQLKGLQDGQKVLSKGQDEIRKDIDEIRQTVGIIEKKTKTVADQHGKG